ncbi:MAG: hypothetical protein ACFFBD_05160 [Candidatus Hodarchaeota archaeon]
MDWTYELVSSVLGEEALKVLLNLGWVEGHGELELGAFEYLNPEEFTLGIAPKSQRAIILLLSKMGLLQKIKGEWKLSRNGVKLFQVALTQMF